MAISPELGSDKMQVKPSCGTQLKSNVVSMVNPRLLNYSRPCLLVFLIAILSIGVSIGILIAQLSSCTATPVVVLGNNHVVESTLRKMMDTGSVCLNNLPMQLVSYSNTWAVTGESCKQDFDFLPICEDGPYWDEYALIESEYHDIYKRCGKGEDYPSSTTAVINIEDWNAVAEYQVIYTTCPGFFVAFGSTLGYSAYIETGITFLVVVLLTCCGCTRSLNTFSTIFSTALAAADESAGIDIAVTNLKVQVQEIQKRFVDLEAGFVAARVPDSVDIEMTAV